MKLRTKVKSNLSRIIGGNFPGTYTKVILRLTAPRTGMPEVRLQKPLAQCTIALLTTAGTHLKTDSPSDIHNPTGDHTLRIIPKDTKEEDLTVTHIYYDVRYAKIDPSIVFPLTQLNALKEEGTIDAVSEVNIGLNGGILDPTAAEKESVPKAVDLLTRQDVDIALLVPGWGTCHNVLGLYARVLEQAGVATVMITILPEITDKVGAPRTLHVPFRLGRPCGEPFDFATRRQAILQLLELAKQSAGTRFAFVPISSDL